MQTYYELEDYHYEIINEHGYQIGTEVYFIKDVLNQSNFVPVVKTAKITGFDITIDGEILFNLSYDKVIKVDPDSWDTAKERTWTTNIERLMDLVSKDKEKLLEIYIHQYINKVKSFENSLKRTKKYLEILKKELDKQ